MTFSAIIIHADHGLHYTWEFSTYEGYIHHKQPTMMMLLPTGLLDAHPNFQASLEHNKHILTTHNDFHMTLMHLAYGGGAEKFMPQPVSNSSENAPLDHYNEYNNYINNFLADPEFRTRTNNPSVNLKKLDAQIHGQSFFTPMDKKRTCTSLAVPQEYCPCVQYDNLNYTKPDDKTLIDKALQKTATFINNYLSQHKLDTICNKISFDPLKDLQKNDISFSSGFYMNTANAEYQISMTVNNYNAKLRLKIGGEALIESPVDDIRDVQIMQDTRFGLEWSQCLPRLRRALGTDMSAPENDVEKTARNFCFCTKSFSLEENIV